MTLLSRLGIEIDTDPPMRTLRTLCAWCSETLSETRVPEAALPTGSLPPGDIENHSICGDCAEELDIMSEEALS